MTIESTYHLKWISWNSGMIPIVMQSANGPCPLIATMNVLLLKEKIKLPEMLEQITEAQLLAYIGESIMDSVPPPDMQNDENFLLNLEQNIHDAIEILPKLKSGLDVNIRFTGITDFEYTPECIIFDLLRIHLYHGWLTDPESSVLQEAIGNQSYNQLVDCIITNKASSDPAIATKVLVAENFLEGTASQLTVYGLNELKSKILDNEIGILFRNNHFLTLFKRDGEIYTLVTDHGYLTESNIVWETLDSIEGAGVFFDANFQLSELVNRQVQASKDEQLVNDFLVALSLKEEESESDPVQDLDAAERKRQLELKDLEMAKRLQEEEDGLSNLSRRDRNSTNSWANHLSSSSTGTNNDRSLALVPFSSNVSPATPVSPLTHKDTQTIQQAEPLAETTKSLDTRPRPPSSSDHRTFPKLAEGSARPYESSAAADGNRDGPLTLQRNDSSITSMPSPDCVEVIPQRTPSANLISQDDTNSFDQNQHRQHATQETRPFMAQSPPTYAAVVDPTRGPDESNLQYQTDPIVSAQTNQQQQPRPSSGRNGNRPRGEKSRESSCRVH